MTNGTRKFQLIMELQQLAKRAFLHKLKVKKPHLTEKEIRTELNRWYQVRPGAEHGDGVGRIGDPSRFD